MKMNLAVFFLKVNTDYYGGEILFQERRVGLLFFLD